MTWAGTSACECQNGRLRTYLRLLRVAVQLQARVAGLGRGAQILRRPCQLCQSKRRL